MRSIPIPTIKALHIWANKLATSITAGSILILQGPLGAGKTTFTKAFAKALGVHAALRSPTFTLMHVYKIPKSKISGLNYLVHADAYRIEDPKAWHDIGLTEWLDRNDAIVVVEWGEKIKPLLRGKKIITLRFQHGEKETERIITLR